MMSDTIEELTGYPRFIFDSAADDERESMLADAAAKLDCDAADLLDVIADVDRVVWCDLAAVRKMRQTLRSVSGWLRERA
jgi:hypothetical protein